MQKSTAQLSDEMSLPELQDYITRKIAERGLDKESTQQKFALLVEEVGELAKSLRKSSGIKIADDSMSHSIEDEAADVFWSLIAVCNTLDIDLLQAVRLKEEKNHARVWS